MVSPLLARIFPITHQHRSVIGIDVLPQNAADFLLTHARCHRKPDDPTRRQHLAWILVKVEDQTREFVGCRPAITLSASCDEAQPLKGDASEVDGFRGYFDAVNCRSVIDDKLDIAEVHADRDTTGAFPCPILAKLDKALACEITQAQAAELPFQGIESEGLAPAPRAIDLLHVIDTEIDEVPESSEVPEGRFRRRIAQIDVPLRRESPFTGVCVASKRLADVGALRRTWARQLPDGSRLKVAMACALRVLWHGETGRFQAFLSAHERTRRVQ